MQKREQTAAFAASAEPSSDEILITLLAHGADVNTKKMSDRSIPLHVAAMTGSSSVVAVLLKAGGDETAVNDQGEMPLDVVGRGYGWRYSVGYDGIRSQLVNAPRDRADRAWSRRGLLVLCRTFPRRVRLGLALPEDGGVKGDTFAELDVAYGSRMLRFQPIMATRVENHALSAREQ